MKLSKINENRTIQLIGVFCLIFVAGIIVFFTFPNMISLQQIFSVIGIDVPFDKIESAIILSFVSAILSTLLLWLLKD